MPNPTIDKLRLPSGNTYDLVDSGARDLIAALSGSTRYLGVTTTALTDGSRINPITVDGQSVTVTTGNIVIYQKEEFIWDGTKWNAFGDLSTLGKLATKDNVTVYKGAGDMVLGEDTTFTVSKPNITMTGSLSDNFVKSYPGTTSKLVTDTVPNVTSVGSASTWAFQMGTGSDATTLIISGDNSVAPTLGTAKTVATGSLASNGGGSDVMTGLGTPTRGSAVTSVGGATLDAAPTVTVGTNDKVKVAKYDELVGGDGVIMSSATAYTITFTAPGVSGITLPDNTAVAAGSQFYLETGVIPEYNCTATMGGSDITGECCYIGSGDAGMMWIIDIQSVTGNVVVTFSNI